MIMKKIKNGNFDLMFFLILVCLIFPLSILANSDSVLEAQIANFMEYERNQGRSSLNYNPILARIARERAYDLGQRNYFDHVNPEGMGPNYLVTLAGYHLPAHYEKGKWGNNIESIAAGSATAEGAWYQWMNSTAHRTHLLGLDRFYAEQTEYGIGHAFVWNSEYKHYWVVITAPPDWSNVFSRNTNTISSLFSANL